MKVDVFTLLGVLSTAGATVSSPQKRFVHIKDRQFIHTASGEPIILKGPNVVVKGPPYLPEVAGDTYCVDNTQGECVDSGTCTSCSTFNQADVDHIKSMGWNSIRLGVVWTGAQPEDVDHLDPNFLERLHTVLDLTDKNELYVVLDNHGDMVSSANCGNGAPMWFSMQASPDLIGKPLETGFPFNIIPSLDIKNLEGYDTCGDNEEKWAQHAGDPNYNLLNECCQAMNSPNPGAIGYTTIGQAGMDYMVLEGPGRDKFVRYWKLMAEAVVDHPSAIAAELMNEPMTLRRTAMFDTWKAAGEAIISVIPDMSVAVCESGEGPLIPASFTEHNSDFLISEDTIDWMKQSDNLFYAWHWYGSPKSTDQAVENMEAIGDAWNMPTYLTEFMDCGAWNSALAANISINYWHYSAYCNTGSAFGNPSVPEESFGACILGWDGGDSSKTC